MTSYEWETNFVVEGLLPKALPKSIFRDHVLEEIETGKEQRRALLTIKIFREFSPSQKEIDEVKKIAIRKATRFVGLYSLFVGKLRLADENPTITQITPYEGIAHHSTSILVGAYLTLSDKIWSDRLASLREVSKLPIKDYLQLALSHYNLAAWIEPKSSFLNLMICIEALYNTSSQEIRKTISHRMANLLGKTDELRFKIYNDISKLYKIRNDLVHGKKSVVISSKKKKLLEIYSRYSLHAFLKLNREKETLAKELDKSIYCEKTREEIQGKINETLEAFEHTLREMAQ